MQPSQAETLLVSGSIDYSTPARAATEELLPAPANGRQLILAEYGHTSHIWSFQPEATSHLLATFFATREGDDSLFTYQPMDFDPGMMRFPFLAKVLALVVWLIARRVRRRRASQPAAHDADRAMAL